MHAWPIGSPLTNQPGARAESPALKEPGDRGGCVVTAFQASKHFGGDSTQPFRLGCHMTGFQP
jgi:hypothetical protein